MDRTVLPTAAVLCNEERGMFRLCLCIEDASREAVEVGGVRVAVVRRILVRLGNKQQDLR